MRPRNLTPIVPLCIKWHDNDPTFGHQLPDYDSLATQSTSESHQEVSGMSEGSLNDHNDQSGNHDGYSKSDENKMMSALSLGNPETAYAHPKTDRSQSFAISYPYADSYYGGPVAAYGQHATMLSWMNMFRKMRYCRETVEPIIPIIFQRTTATCFAYGQTGEVCEACFNNALSMILYYKMSGSSPNSQEDGHDNGTTRDSCEEMRTCLNFRVCIRCH